jgi:hypothetical protein
MRTLLLTSLACLMLGCTTAPRVPQPELVDTSYGDGQVGREVAAVAQQLDISKTSTEIFEVGYTIDYGYSLIRSTNRDALIEPVFVGAAPRMEFDYGYEQLINQPDIVGKRILCECQGVSFRVYETEHFRVTRVRLYAE